MGLAGSSDSGLLGWSVLVVDSDQSVVKLLGVGESAASLSGLQGGLVQCCQHVIYD